MKTLTNEHSPYLTIHDVAKRYQLHPETVRRWILDGRLPAFKLAGGTAWRIREEALAAIEQQTQG